jgi:hypothetical protein
MACFIFVAVTAVVLFNSLCHLLSPFGRICRKILDTLEKSIREFEDLRRKHSSFRIWPVVRLSSFRGWYCSYILNCLIAFLLEHVT